MVSDSIYVEKVVWGGGGGGSLPPRSQRHLEISNKMESFPSYGSRIFFSLFLRPYYFFSTPLEPCNFFIAYQEPKYFFR